MTATMTPRPLAAAMRLMPATLRQVVPPVLGEIAGRQAEPRQRLRQLDPEARIDDRHRALEELGREELAAPVGNAFAELVEAHLLDLEGLDPRIEFADHPRLLLALLARLGRFAGAFRRLRAELGQPVARLGEPRLDLADGFAEGVAHRVETAAQPAQFPVAELALQRRLHLVEHSAGRIEHRLRGGGGGQQRCRGRWSRRCRGRGRRRLGEGGKGRGQREGGEDGQHREAGAPGREAREEGRCRRAVHGDSRRAEGSGAWHGSTRGGAAGRPLRPQRRIGGV
jgi:hypothetical protein